MLGSRARTQPTGRLGHFSTYAFQKYGHGAGVTPCSALDLAERALKSPTLISGTSSAITCCTPAQSFTRSSCVSAWLKAPTAFSLAGVSHQPGEPLARAPISAGSGRNGLWLI